MTTLDRVLRNQVRGVTGALIVSGVVVLLTMESWWLSWTRPASHLVAFTLVGLGVVLAITRTSGFRVEEEEDEDDGEDQEDEDGGDDQEVEDGEDQEQEDDEEGGGDVSQYDPVRLTVDFAELVLQSLVAATVVFFIYGVVTLSTPWHVVARMGLLHVVPLGFGAALANRLLHETEEQRGESAEEQSLPTNLGIFAAGAIFFALPLVGSVEIDVLASTAGWPRLAAIVALSLLTAYLILYELEFRGQSGRTADRESAALLHAGQTCIVYAVGLAVAAPLLWGFGQFTFSLAVDLQKLVVLSFPATVGAAAARVVL